MPKFGNPNHTVIDSTPTANSCATTLIETSARERVVAAQPRDRNATEHHRDARGEHERHAVDVDAATGRVVGGVRYQSRTHCAHI